MPGLFVLALFASPVDLQWQAPDGCPSGADFLAQMSDPADEALPLRVTLNVRARADGTWEAELTMLREGSAVEQRSIEGESCQAVVDAAALITELRKNRLEETLAPETFVEPPPPLPETDGPGNDEPSPDTPQEAPPAVTSVTPVLRLDDDKPRAGNSLGAWLSFSGGVAAGVLPGVGGSAALEGGIDGAAWRVGLAARLFPARTQQSTGASVEGRFALATGGALGCYVPHLRTWSFPTCARVDVGTLRGEGRNTAQSRVVWPLWAGVSASASAHWQLADRIAPFVTLEGAAALLAPSYAVGGMADAFFRAGRLGLRAWVGFEIRLKNGPQKH